MRGGILDQPWACRALECGSSLMLLQHPNGSRSWFPELDVPANVRVLMTIRPKPCIVKSPLRGI